MISLNMDGCVTLVIGGTRGIGASIVRLAAESGSKIAWTGRPVTSGEMQAPSALLDELRSSGADAVCGAVDCTDAAGTARFVEDVIFRWGRLDNLVYCAGYTSPASFLDIAVEDWNRVVDINLTGAFVATRSVIPQMKSQGAGSIVLIGSAAVVSGGGGRADYVSGKAGLEGLNRAITKEFAPSGIRCNLVHPSLIATDLLSNRHPDPGVRRKLAEKVPLRRLGEAEDVANLAVFLLSEKASYITGQSILVDGGRSYCG
jgi:3-oxoacyl-[acyl-carrier protein] reductase